MEGFKSNGQSNGVENGPTAPVDKTYDIVRLRSKNGHRIQPTVGGV